MTLQLHGNSAQSQRTSIMDTLVDYGHWVIYRRYDLSTESSYVDPATEEGVGGSKWDYSDFPILVRHDPASVRSTAGVITEKSKIFIDYSMSPKRGDVIIEINYDGENRDLTPGLVMQMDHREAYTIDDISFKRGHGGALIYSTCIVVPRLEAY